MLRDARRTLKFCENCQWNKKGKAVLLCCNMFSKVAVVVVVDFIGEGNI